jgi:RNA polymerase sigma-70 factor (ECF subfamily)
MEPGSSDHDVIAQLPTLQRYARSLTRNDSDADDLVQDALVRAYDRRHTFRLGGDLRAWLLSVLHNSFVSGHRSRRAEAARIKATGDLAPAHAEPAQEHAVELASVRAAFGDLPAEQRAALHLVAVEGLSYQEAAASLGVPIGTVMSRLSRARAALRAPAPAHSTAADPPPRFRIVGGRHGA